MDYDSDQRGYVVGRGKGGGRGGPVTVLLGADRATEGRWRCEMGSSFGSSSHRWLFRWHSSWEAESENMSSIKVTPHGEADAWSTTHVKGLGPSGTLLAGAQRSF
jgi:hypothetical protein